MRGSLRQRSPGTWQLRYDGPRGQNGGRKYVVETVRVNKKEAERLLRERVAAAESGTYVGRSTETVGEFHARWLDTYAAQHTSLRTQQGYRQLFEWNIRPRIGNLRLQDLRPAHVEELYVALQGRGVTTTVRRVHALLHKVLDDAMRRGLIARNPTTGVDVPPETKVELDIWSPDEVNTFFHEAKSSAFHDVYELAIDTGMRRGELAGTLREFVDLDAATLLVGGQLQRITGRGLVFSEPKRRQRRLLELSPSTVEMLRGVRRRQLETQLAAGPGWHETGYVFTNSVGKPLDSARLTRDFKEIVKRAGLPHLTPHGLRHTNATLMIKDGVDVHVISRRLGHASIRTTLDVYGHLMPGMQDQAVGAVGRQLGRG